MSAIGVAVCGRYGGLFAPLAIVTLIMVRLVPWDVNVVVNEDLVEARVAAALSILVLSLSLYALKGPARG